MSVPAGSAEDQAVDAAFRNFVTESSRALLRSAFLLVGDRGSAEDLLQQTLFRTSQHWSRAAEAPQAYARTVLLNLSRDAHRQRARRVHEAPLDAVVIDPGQDDHAGGVIGRDAMLGALRRLPPRQREVVVLRFYCDLSVAETATAIGGSEGTVKSYTARALHRLRDLLGESSPPVSRTTREGDS